VHGEQGLILHHPLPPRGRVVGRSRVVSIVDKGAAKGAVVTVERTVSDADGGPLYATIRQVSFCRGDGGYCASGSPSDPAPPMLPATPDSPPDAVFDQPTRADTALLYRLLADRNPLHADPAAAHAAGFAKPLLHGLATYGLAAAAILHTFAGMEPDCLKSLEVRFSSQVYPGETLRTEMWRKGSQVQFRCRVIERDVIALSHGRAVLAGVSL
jgi:acyl dehydratase